MEKVVCFVCNGDGKETCNNPDHGFITALSFHDIGRIGCPCCGHDENHKVVYWKDGKYNQNDCDACSGTGELTLDEANKLADEYQYDNEFETITT